MLKTFIIHLEKVASFFRLGIHLYARSYKEIVKNEIALARIDSRDTVLNIGCGAIPFTAIHLAKEAQCKVIAVDHDALAVKRAQRVIRKLRLSSQVSVHHKDGEAPLDLTYNKAILALQTHPLKTVIETVFSPSRTIVVRQPFESHQSLYDKVPEGYSAERSVYQPMKAFGYSVVLNKHTPD